MTPWLPEIEGWVKLAGAAVAVVMAVLVPVRSWIAEDRRHRAQALDILRSATPSPAAHLSSTSHVLADSLALGAVAEGLHELAQALRRLSELGENGTDDRLARAISALIAEPGDRP